MADIRLAKPVAGTTQTVPSAPDGRFIFDFPADAATLTRNGDDLVLSFEDGSSIRLQGFYTTYSKEDMPSFQVEGVESSGQDFFAALGEDLMPAAGPAAGSSASRGGRYNEYGGSDLLDGIDHLGRLDIGFGDGVEWADDQVGGWTHQNLDPEISGIIAVDGNDMTLVESGVETDGSQKIQGNVFTPGVPVVVGQVMASDPDGGRLSYSFADGSNRIVTEYGVITIDADTGVITYTLNNDDPDADSLALGETVRQDFTVRVEDGQGGKAEASFSVTIKGTNDQPEVTLDADSELGLIESGVGRTDDGQVVTAPGTEEENQAYDGSHADDKGTQQLEGKVTGADVDAGHKLWFGAVAGDKSQDGSWEGAQSPDADIFLGKDATDGDVESSEPVEGSFGHLVLNSDGTWTYTLKGEGETVQGTASLDGETFDISSIDALPEGATITDTFTIYVKDEHGAWNLETVTITITGSNDAPSLTVGDPDGLLYESGVGRDTTTSDHRPFDKPGQPEENNPYDNDAAGTASVTGSINAADVDHGDILHFAVADGTGMTAPEGLELTAGSQTSVTAQGHYGQLVVTETANGTASYTYTLHGNSDGIPLSFPVTVNGTTYAGLEELKQGLDWDFDGQPTLDNLPEGATVSESFTIFVQDDKGAWQQQEVSFTITGTNDQPEVTLDADSELGLIESGVGRTDDGQVVTAPGTEEENQAYDGSHADDKGTQQLEGKVTGADVDAGHKLWFGAVAGDKSQDGSWEGAQSPDADIFLGKDVTDGDVESSEPVEGSFGHLVLNSDGTWTYTLKGEGEAVQGTASLDGETFDISSIDALPEGATITDTFTIYVKDEHGAWNLETVTITITGSNDKPSLEIRDGNGQILTDGAVLETIESDPADADDATSWPQLSGSFDIRDVDADAGSDQTILIAGGTHTDGDVEHATSPAAGHKPQPGHIGSEGGTQAIFTTDYGTLTVNPDGSWTYVVNSGSELVQQLDPEHPHFETFEITVVDEHGAYDTREIVIKVEGSSAFPVITDKDDLVFKEEGVYHDGSDGNTPTEAGDVVDGQGNVIPGHHQTESLSGRVDATDVDLGDQGNLSFRVDAADSQLKTDGTPAVTQPEAPKLVSTSPNGDTVYESGYGTLTFHADGTYTYELKSGAFDADGNAVNKLAQGEVLTETFTVTVRDTFGKEVSTDITITIHGTNDKPRLELGDGSDGGALHVTESGVGRHDDGAVVDGPDDELVDAPSKDGTAADEIGRYDGALTDSDKATGKDADHGAELVYGVEAGKAESPDGVDFTTDGGDVSVRGQYGSLTIGADGSYSYTLDESSDFTAGDGTQYDRLDYLNEGETLTETFTIFVRDEHGAWASKEVTVTVTGTNDRPTLDVLDGKKFFDASGKEIAVADDRLHAYGTADSAADAVVRLSGRVQASDDDRENGAGQETTDGDNHGLQFSLQGTGYDPALTSSSVWKDSSGHDLLRSGPVEVSRSGDGGYVATTEYGTLTLDQYGNYTYELRDGDDDVTALGKGETVTETFVVRVVDHRGAWSEKTITITIEGTDDKPVLSDDTESALDVYETGVWGDQSGAHRPDDIFTGGPTGSQTVTVSFEKQDANDRHSLVIAGSGLPANASLTVTDGGTPVEGAIYSIVAGANGTYTLTAVIPGVNEGKSIMLGTLRLEQNGTDSDLTYTFVPTQSGLNGLPQDMDLSIDIPLKVKDQNGNLSEGEHTATINIHGTNDRPTIKVTGRAPEDVYADGVGREENGIAVATPDKTVLNPEENAPYESRSVEGQLTASDVDAGDTTFSYFVDKVGGISNPALTATVGDGRTTVTLSLSGVAVAELTLDPATGKYSLSLLDTDEARAALAPYGEDVKFDFTVYFNVRDEHGSTAQTSASQKFSIHGTNDAPEIKDASDLGLDEGMVSVAGQVSAEDADAGHKLTYGLLSDPHFGSLNGADPESVGMTTSLSNEFGTLKIDPATGKYTFYLDAESEAVISLPEGEKKELTFHVAVRDDKGAWDVKDITVTITGKDTATVFVGDAAVVPVVEAGVVPDMHPGTENQSEDGSPVASGKLEAKDYDTVDGRPNEVEYSINTTESGQEPATSAFSKLGSDIQEAISQQFPEEAWGADADIQIMQGQYGTLYLNTSTGQYFYQLDNDSDATNALKRGEIRYDDFSIHAQGTGKGDAQGADQPLKVAVKGSNDAPEVTGVTLDKGQTGLEVSDDGFTVTGIVEDGGTKTVTGQIGATDVDSPDGSTADEGSVLKYLIKVTGEDGSVRYVGAQSGEYGYLKLNEKTGEYTFVFNNKAAQHLGAGDIGEASFTVVVLDEYNAISEEKELTFEITGKDDAPRISGSAASITEDTGISVNIQPVTITDPDTGDEQHITSIASQGGEPVDLTTGDGPWKTEGEYGTLTVTRNEDGSLSYTYQLTEEGRNRLQYLNEDGAHTSVQENFTVTGTSGGQSVTGGITVTINGDNDAPTLELTGPDGQIVSEEDPVEVKDWNPVKGTAAGDDVDDAEGDLRYSVDDADSATAAQDGLQTIKGEFGYLTIDAETGEYTYVVDPFSEEYKKLQTGEQGKEHFTITVTDPYGATDTKEIVFDVTKVEGGTGPGSVELQEPEDPTNVIEDGGDYDVILPPSVASDFTELKDGEGKPVKVDADDIWLVDNKGQSDIVDGDMTHVVQTEYGSLILEKGDDGQWGYRFVLNNSSDIVQSLDEDDSIEKTFYVSAGTNRVPIHVTITGINDQPVIESVGHLSIEDTGGIVTGKVTTTDPDAGDVGSNEAGEGSEQNLSYAVSAVEGSGITLTPKDGQAMGAPGTYTLTKDGTDWGEFTLNKDGSYSFKPSAEAEKLLAGENANFNLTITVDDGSGAPNSSTEENLHITITGTNEAPVINGGELTLEATEDTAITVGDKLDVSDDRVNEGNLSYSVAAGEGAASSNAGNMAAGQYGTLFINADGTYSYQLNNQMQAVQELGEDSEPLEETFTIFVKDQDGAEVAKNVTVTINGTNDAPVLSLDTPVLTIKEGSTAEVGGTASATDVDKGDTLSYALKDGTLSEETGEYVCKTDYGTFSIDPVTGEYRFVLDNSLDAVKDLRPTDVVDAKVTVVVDDGHGGVTEKELTVHIKGSDSVPEITDEGSLAIDVAEEPESTAEKDIAAEGWDHGPDGTHDDPLHYAAQGAQPVTIDGQVWQMVTGKYGTLYLDPKTGKYRYELTEDMNHLADGETATESFGKITIADSTGNKITETITVTIKGSNDAPEIAVSQPSGALAGTVTITDVDASDTHSVTFEGLRADAAGTPLSVDLATLEQEGGTTTVDVYDADGTLIGKLELVYTKGTGTDDSLSYTFTPDEGYLNSLPVNGSQDIDFSITVSDTHDGTDTTDGLQFSVSNVNDAPVIDEILSQGPAEGSNTGTLAFTDADVRDAHSVTFGGLSADAAGTPLTVPNVEGLIEDTEVPVYRDGLQIGTLTLSYADGKLSYTLSTEGFENNLPVGESSIGFDLTVTDTQGSSDQLDGLQFGVSNVNDAPVIDETLSQGPTEGSNTGTLAFTDADVRDAHSVTFGGLSADAAGTPLTVSNVEGLTGDTEVPVYRDGLQIGTLTLSYADGQLSYTLSTEGFENNLPVGESSIGFDLTVTDAQGSSGTAEDLQFRVTGNGTTGGGIPAGEDDAALRAQSERQRLAAEESGLLTAAASFVAGITPEPADPETFLRDTVPAQENGPEALVAEEVPLPQDETVLQEEMTDLPDADVPVSETPLADDLLAEPLLFAGLENADEMPEPVEMLRFETTEDMLPAEDADPATAATPPAFSGEEAGDGGLLLPEGVEGLFGTDGDDYLRGGEGSDAIFGGAGNDIIVYDQQDYLVSGGSGIDFMVSDDTSLTLDGLLSNTSSDKPLVSGIEVLLKGEDALSLTSINDLADRYGITLGVNEAGEETLQLDDRWTKQDDGSYDFNGGAEADGGLTLETSLTPVETGDPASEAVQQQVFTLEHSNG